MNYRLTAIALCVPVAAYASDQSSLEDSTCLFSSSVQFTESAPRDRFTVNNTSDDGDITRVMLDLSTSAGNLIFDVTADGAGVEVFQPYRSENGTATLSAEPVVDDGDQTIILTFSSFNPGQTHQFSIDIDDQLSQSELGQIRVSGGEITGATVTLDFTTSVGKENSVSAVFDSTNQARAISGNC